MLASLSLQKSAAQQPYHLGLQLVDTSRRAVFGEMKYRTWFRSEKRLHSELQDIISGLIEEGHLAAGYDSITTDSVHHTAWLYIGPQFFIANLRPGNTDPVVLSQAGFKTRYFSGVPLNPSGLLELYREILKYYEDNGYPFASVKLDSIIIHHDTLDAALVTQRGPLINYDSITVKGSTRIRRAYLQNFLEIKPGQLYNESRVVKISGRLREVPFIKEIKPFEIGFTKEKARVILYLEKKKASQFDGIIGVAPNSATDGKLLLTGDLNLSLVNAINRGEAFEFRWHKNEPLTQELEIRFNYPFLFNTPFGLDYQFDLLKRDTTFLTLRNHIGLEYLFRSDHILKAYIEFMNSSLLGTQGLESTTDPPSYADISISSYGLEYFLSLLDYRYNPRKGIMIRGNASFGNKTIRKNPSVNPELYDSIDLRNNIYKSLLDISLHVPLLRRATLLFRTQNGYLYNDHLFENELFRIGGLRSLRGFDEQSIYASSYSIMTAEFRYLFEQNSYFSFFWNGAWYERNTTTEYISDAPWGFGAGLSFQTGAGVFSVFYALGKQFDNPFDLKSAKVHFGYSSLF